MNLRSVVLVLALVANAAAYEVRPPPPAVARPFDRAALLTRALAGDAQAQLELARHDRFGNAAQRALAWRFAERAARQDLAPAIHLLGSMEQRRDASHFGRWRDLYERAAAMGYTRSQAALGHALLNDTRSAPSERAEGLRWLRTAANAGHEGAQEKLHEIEPPAWPVWALVALALAAAAWRTAPARGAGWWASLENRRFWLGFSAACFAAWCLALAGVPGLGWFALPGEYMLYWAPLAGVYAVDRRCRLKPVYQASLAFGVIQLFYMSSSWYRWIDWSWPSVTFAWCAAAQGAAIGLIARRHVLSSALCAGLILAADLVLERQLHVWSATQVLGHTVRFVAQSGLAALAASWFVRRAI